MAVVAGAFAILVAGAALSFGGEGGAAAVGVREEVFLVMGDDGERIKDAVVTLDGVTQGPGEYTFSPEIHGRKKFTITREGYVPLGGQYCYVDYKGERIEVDVTMQVEDDIDISDVFWHNQNIFCKFEDGTLRMSLDYGRTYTHSIDLSEIASDYRDIKTLWIFEDNLLFFADLTRCFYSHDWETYRESEVYDIESLNIEWHHGYMHWSCDTGRISRGRVPGALCPGAGQHGADCESRRTRVIEGNAE